MKRPTLEQACAKYVHRFTMEHVPRWARDTATNGKYYAPHFRSDAEWYANTYFPGEPDHPAPTDDYCYTHDQTWPLGKWLDAQYAIKSRD